jgi:hypothetical protein
MDRRLLTWAVGISCQAGAGDDRPLRRGSLATRSRISSDVTETIRIFRAPLRSGLVGVDHAKQVAYCLTHGVLGLGWRLEPPPRSLEEALSRVRAEFSGSAASTIRRFAEAPGGSLVWSRDVTGRYLLGSFCGPWRYESSAEATVVNVHQVRPVSWAPRSLLDVEVPGAVIRAWVGPGSSFSEIHNETARLFSVRLLDELQGKSPATLQMSRANVLRELLDPFDVEDLVYMCLQLAHDYLVVPASRRTDTSTYEYVLMRRKDARKAVVQVKTGSAAVDVDALLSAAAGEAQAIAYATSGSYVGATERAIIITDDELLTFARTHDGFLPPRVRRWFDYARA